MNTLAIDIGGSKLTLAAFVDGQMARRASRPTERAGGAGWMIAQIVEIASQWQQEIPFDRNEATRVLEGRTNLRIRYEHLFEVFDSSTFTVDAVHPHADPEWVSVEYHGHIVANDGTVFENTYLAMFQVRDGLIHQFREFFAPVIPEDRLGL